MKFPKFTDIKNLDDLKKLGANLAGQALSTVDSLTKPAATISTPIDEQLKNYEDALAVYAELFNKQTEAFNALRRNYEVLKVAVAANLAKPATAPIEAQAVNAQVTEEALENKDDEAKH